MSKVEKLEMLTTPVLGRFEFVVPSLQDEFTYRIVTPSLESDWQTLSAYDPPSLKSVDWVITPPDYTNEKQLSHKDFGYFRAPEGSQIFLS